MNYVFIDAILYIGCRVWGIEQSLRISFVVCKKQVWRSVAMQPILFIRQRDFDHRVRSAMRLEHGGLTRTVAPRPSIPEPDGWQQAKIGRLWTAVANGDFNQNVFDIGFR